MSVRYNRRPLGPRQLRAGMREERQSEVIQFTRVYLSNVATWNSGGGAKAGKHNAVSEDRLDEIYRNPDFVRSLTLDAIGEVLD